MWTICIPLCKKQRQTLLMDWSFRSTSKLPGCPKDTECKVVQSNYLHLSHATRAPQKEGLGVNLDAYELAYELRRPCGCHTYGSKWVHLPKGPWGTTSWTEYDQSSVGVPETTSAYCISSIMQCGSITSTCHNTWDKSRRRADSSF